VVDAADLRFRRAHAASRKTIVQRIMLAPMPKKVFITVEEIARPSST